MTERDERKLTAAEYALGTLTPDERAAFEGAMRRDPALRAELAQWQQRLLPLVDGPPVEPGRDLWPAIAAQLEPAGSGAWAWAKANRRRLLQWCTGAFLAGATAGGLAAFAFLGEAVDAPSTVEKEQAVYIAAVDSQDHQPAFIVVVDVAAGKVSVMPVKPVAPSDGDLQLWHHVTVDAPATPLGVLSVDEKAEFTQAVDEPGLVTVSLEPHGGSPTGAPTGPVLYSGRLMPRE